MSKEVIINSINDYLKNEGWIFRYDKNNSSFAFDVEIDNSIKNLHYQVIVNDQCFVVYALSPIAPDINNAKVMREVTEMICRMNYSMLYGNFEMNCDDAQIRYKLYVKCGEMVSMAEIEESIMWPAIMYERYGFELLEVICGMLPAKEAANKADKRACKELIRVFEELNSEENERINEILDNVARRNGIERERRC